MAFANGQMSEGLKKAARRNVAILVAVFVSLTAVYALIANNDLVLDRESTKTKVELNATVYANEIKTDFSQGIAVTEAVEQAVIATKGNIDNFPEIAENLLDDYVSSIQIAPDGVVTEIFPAEGNEAGFIDLMNDPTRGPICTYARDNDVVTFQGPFDLKQGGTGIAIRNPVFLTDEEGNREFWGFAIAIIDPSAILQETFDALSSFGYDYVLTSTTSPLTTEEKVVMASTESIAPPVSMSFELGACDWCIYVAPKAGWKTSTQQVLFSLAGLSLVVLCTVLVGVLLRESYHRKRLKDLVEKDYLTGILNRTGLANRVSSFFGAHPKGPATEAILDIDDFKLINDLHGHGIGDEALVNLAKNLTEVFSQHGYVARTGGDEFSIFLPSMTAVEAEVLIRRAVDMDQTFMGSDGKSYTYTISIGYADLPAQAETESELARHVDGALYNVKLNGKHGCQRYECGMVAQSRQQLGFSQKELMRYLPGASFICHAEDTRILYVNDGLLSLLECDNFEDFSSYSKGMFQNIIHPEDFERVITERNIKQMNAKPNGYITCFFRIVTRTGVIKSARAQARFRNHPAYGDLFFVMLMETDTEGECTTCGAPPE